MKSIFATILVLLALAVACRANTTVYYPNSTGAHVFGAAWYPWTLPPNDICGGVECSDADYVANTISTDDANNWLPFGDAWDADGPSRGGVIQIVVTEAVETITQLKWTVKGYGEERTGIGGEIADYNLYLWSYNYNSAVYDNQQFTGATSKDTLTITIASDIANYLKPVDNVASLSFATLCQMYPGTDFMYPYIYYVELEVTYSGGAAPARRVIVTSGSGN